MKKVLWVLVLLGVMASCGNVGNKGKDTEETIIRQRVEEMILSGTNEILTSELLAIQQHAQSVYFEDAYFFGFEWNTGVFDVCNDVSLDIVDIKLIDSLHSDVKMHYLDEGCYDFHYTLNLLKRNGQWWIDDVTYDEGIYPTLRVEAEAFYEDVAELYRVVSPEEIMEYLLNEEPSENSYTEPGFSFYNNPEAVEDLIDMLQNCHELFKKNPGYTEKYGKQIDAMIERIAEHLNN